QPPPEDAGDGEGELLPGWEQLWSDERRCHYYWHAEAKVASWERPAVLGDSALEEKDGAEEAGEPEEAWAEGGTVRGAPRMATPITPVASVGARAEMTPITPAERRTGFQRPPPPSAVPSTSAQAGLQAGAIGKSAPSKGGHGRAQPSTGAGGKAGPPRIIGAPPGAQQGRPSHGPWPAAKRPRS
ncbi:unnamed protein product, partial [Prorocentrum cordatum]